MQVNMETAKEEREATSNSLGTTTMAAQQALPHGTIVALRLGGDQALSN